MAIFKGSVSFSMSTITGAFILNKWEKGERGGGGWSHYLRDILVEPVHPLLTNADSEIDEDLVRFRSRSVRAPLVHTFEVKKQPSCSS